MDEFFKDVPHSDNDNDAEGRDESNGERFDQACEEIKRRKGFTNESEVTDFLHGYSDIAGIPLTKNDGTNLLHIIVDLVKHNGIEAKNVELLVRQLVKIYPALLIYRDYYRDNPLSKSIKNSVHQLAQYMITACEDGQSTHRQHLEEALTMTGHENKTCLHIVLFDKFDPITARMLMKNASDRALAAQDERGKTPMHFAVRPTMFDKHADEMEEIIALFIDRDLKAVEWQEDNRKSFLDLCDNDRSSIYQECQITWVAHMRKKQRSQERETHENAGNQNRDQSDASRLADLSTAKQHQSPNNITSTKSLGSRGVDKADEELVSREKERQKKKDEEAAALRKKDPSAPATSLKEPDNTDMSQSDINNARFPIRAGIATRPSELAPNTGLKRRNTLLENGVGQEKEKEKGLQNAGLPILRNPKGSNDLDALFKRATKILHSLKLHYMRTRTTEMVLSFLYGTNPKNVHVSFDYDHLPATVSWDKFIKRFGKNKESGLQFDSVLQYVTFPHVEVHEKPGRLANPNRRDESQREKLQVGPLGRKDMNYFFDWLYCKGVRHIIALSVGEPWGLDKRVHSDEAIQQCLERFGIESLDWQKIDLDPETILHAGSKVSQEHSPAPGAPKGPLSVLDRPLQKLYLRWSGSNAALRAWSESEGLPMLPQLREIYLCNPPYDKMRDDLEWVKKKVAAFENRLNKNRKSSDNIKVQTIDTTTDEKRKEISSSTIHTTSENSHRWMKSTKKFAEEMMPFWQNTVEEFLSEKNIGTTEGIEKDVVVALIDDGIDVFDMDLSDGCLEGKSFDFHDGKLLPPFSSAQGHGTVMANMILQVCPMAKIYPIRLKTYPNENGKNNIDVYYAAQAIQAALDKQATIISMSWTLPIKDHSNYDPSKNPLHNVLKKAVDDKVLMFCSAPDQGKFTELDYPSGPWPGHFFRIGAAGANGVVFRWTQERDITYVLPGVDVTINKSGSRSSGSKDVKLETGSSVATALAAGLAAMIIYCVKASILIVKTANKTEDPILSVMIPEERASRIADTDAMRRAFASLGTVTENKFIQVWEQLDLISRRLEDTRRRPQEKLQCIKDFVGFGHKLMNSG